MPSLAESACRNIAMRLLIRITLSSVYPNFEPPPRSVAQFPGSIYPSATREPGPAKAGTLRIQEAVADTGMVRWASGREGRRGRQAGKDAAEGEAVSAARSAGDAASSCCSVGSSIVPSAFGQVLTMVNTVRKLRLISLACQ